MDEDLEYFRPTFDLGEFRYEVARYFKHLVRARWKLDPGFLNNEELARWDLRNIEKDNVVPERLMDFAAANLARLNCDFIPRCGSGGVPITEDTPVGRLIEEVAFFVLPDGGGPEHNKALVDAASLLRQGGRIDWTAFAEWDQLPTIRSDLDQLPHPGQYDHRDTGERDNIFRQNGGQWNIEYQGETCVVRDLVGLYYLKILVAAPGRQHDPIELWNTKNRFRLDQPASSADRYVGEEESVNIAQGGSRDFQHKDALSTVKARLSDIGEIVRSTGLTEPLEKERDTLVRELSRLRQRGEGSNNSRKNRRDAVRKAIIAALRAISETNQAIGTHFTNAVRLDDQFSYQPEAEIAWRE